MELLCCKAINLLVFSELSQVTDKAKKVALTAGEERLAGAGPLSAPLGLRAIPTPPAPPPAEAPPPSIS